ncbi:hypothetical protein [Nocardia alba]|nr:hypothetical protein [Nocardia alba]
MDLFDTRKFAALFTARTALGAAVAPVSRLLGGAARGGRCSHSMVVIGCLLAAIPALTLACRPLAGNDAEIRKRREVAHV